MLTSTARWVELGLATLLRNANVVTVSLPPSPQSEGQSDVFTVQTMDTMALPIADVVGRRDVVVGEVCFA